MIAGKKVLGLIPARGGSKGVVGKNLRLVGGKPLLVWTIEQALQSACLDRLVLSSDDDEIVAAGRNNGCEVPFMRPPELAVDDTPAVSVALHALDALAEQYDYLVLLQPTSPLRITADIDGAIRCCVERGASACVSVVQTEELPAWMYVVGQNGTLVPLLGETSSFPCRRQDAPPVYVLNGAVYVVQTDWFRSVRAFVGPGTVPFVMPRSRSLDIDTEEDLRYFAFLLAERSSS